MPKLFIALLLVLSAYCAQGQEFFAGLLQPLRLQHLKQTVDRWEAASSDTSAEWQYLRPVSPKGYKEGLLLVSVRQKPGHGIHEFRISILAKGDRIFFYQVAGEACTGDKDSSVCVFLPLDTYKAEKQWQQMNKAFKNFFGVAIDTAELFVQDFPFGYRCDFAGSYTPGKEFMDSMTLQQNKAAILQWLHSANTEKQLFAAFALRKLNRQGISLDRAERRKIRFVLNKKGTVYFCSYCLYGAESSRKTVKFYKNHPEPEAAE